MMLEGLVLAPWGCGADREAVGSGGMAMGQLIREVL